MMYRVRSTMSPIPRRMAPLSSCEVSAKNNQATPSASRNASTAIVRASLPQWLYCEAISTAVDSGVNNEAATVAAPSNSAVLIASRHFAAAPGSEAAAKSPKIGSPRAPRFQN